MAKNVALKTAVGLAAAPLVLLAALFIHAFYFDDTAREANESFAVLSLHTLYSANLAYVKGHPEAGYPKNLEDLARAPDASEQQNDPEWTINPFLAGGMRSGYRFVYTPRSSNGGAKLDDYEVSADPLKPGISGKRHFFMEHTQNHNSMTGEQANSFIKRWTATEEQMAQLRLKWVPEFEKVISPKKTAMFYQIDRRLGLMVELQLSSRIPLVKP